MERMIGQRDLENGAGAYGARQFTSVAISELVSSAAQSHAGFKGDRLLVQWWKFIELCLNELKQVFPELERDVIQT